MKSVKFLFLLFILLGSHTFSQNLRDVEKLASNYNNTFEVLERNMNIKPYDRVSKFGLESRMYVIKSFKVLAESNNEQNTISKISILTNKSFDNDELWYNITKSANSDNEFKFVNSLISSKDDDVYEKDIDFVKIVDLLRKSKSLDDYLYYITYSKNSKYYKFIKGLGTFYCIVTDKQKERD